MGPQGPNSQLHPFHFMDTSWGGEGGWGCRWNYPTSIAGVGFPMTASEAWGLVNNCFVLFSTWYPSVTGHGRLLTLIRAIDIAITDIAPSPAGTWGQQQKFCHDKSCRLGLLSVVAILMTWHISLLKSSTVGVADDTYCTCIYDSVHV